MLNTEDIFRFILGNDVPSWIISFSNYLALILIVLIGLWIILVIASKIKKLWVEDFQPTFYDPEEKRRIRLRQKFARHIMLEITRLDSLEEWRDDRFAELEAEVEAEGRRRAAFLPFFNFSRSGLRREKSLSKALETSRERLILLEGEPGSGKSVALRYVTFMIAQRAMKARNAKSIIPIYINLKELVREEIANNISKEQTKTEILVELRRSIIEQFNQEELQTLCFDLGIDYEILSGDEKSAKVRELIAYCDRHHRTFELVQACRQLRPHASWPTSHDKKLEKIDRNLIEAFVLKSLNRANNRDIEEFLEEEFRRGLEDGTWFFLFDSFDELPEVLSSTEADIIIRNYVDAISDFLHGLNQCRGVVASRQFRGPGQVSWPRFRILPLSESRRMELIDRANLKVEVKRDLIGGLGIADQEVQAMASNPLFLGLLCEHMRDGNEFPQNTYTVFETYMESRIVRDRHRLQKRFEIEPKEVRSAAEKIAFTMAADNGLGLSPTTERLQKAMQRLNFNIDERFEIQLNALKYIKIARSETATTTGKLEVFTFAHRRFQEYFATCVVLREPEHVNPRQLLVDARWRETAVTLCQTQKIDDLFPILEEVRDQLRQMTRTLPGLIEDPVAFVKTVDEKDIDDGIDQLERKLEHFQWPSGLLHLLGILQSGFGARLNDLPTDIRVEMGRIILEASRTGTLADKKWALEVAGVVPEDVMRWLLRDAYDMGSIWLEEVAYRQTARLSAIPNDIAISIRRSLLFLYSDGRLFRERHTVNAHLSRFDHSGGYLSVLKLLLSIGKIDAVILSILFVLYLVLAKTSLLETSFIITALIVSSLTVKAVSQAVYNQSLSDSLQNNSGNFLIVLIGFYVRFGLLLVSTLSPYLFVISLFVFFAPFAFFAARTGQFHHLYWRPFMPLWPMLYFSRNFKRLFTNTLSSLKKYWQLIITMLILLVYTLASFGISVRLYDLWDQSDSFLGFLQQSFPPILIPIPFILLVIFMILGLLYLAGIIILVLLPRWLQDRVYWYKWLKNESTLLEGQEFLLLISRFSFPKLRNRFIRMVRDQELLVASQHTEEMLVTFSLAVEKAINIRKMFFKKNSQNPNIFRWRSDEDKRLGKTVNHNAHQWGRKLSVNELSTLSQKTNQENLSVLKFQELWLTIYTKKGEIPLSILGSEFLDEIYKLLEQLRVRRQDKN